MSEPGRVLQRGRTGQALRVTTAPTASTTVTTAPPPCRREPPPLPHPPSGLPPPDLSAISIDVQRPRTLDRRLPGQGAPWASRPVVALVVKDGHDQLGAAVHWSAPSGRSGRARSRSGSGTWVGTVAPAEVGAHELTVVAWTDRFAHLAPGRDRGVAEAGQDLTVELEVGAQLVEHLAEPGRGPGRRRAAGGGGRRACAASPARIDVRLAAGLDDARWRTPAAGSSRPGIAANRCRTGLWVDRARAGFSTWYELFPRSYGGLRGVRSQLPRLADMGFDVLYLPPIHPIGTHPPQGPQQHAGGPARRCRQPVGDRLAPTAATTPSTPTSARWTTSPTWSGTPPRHGIEIALDYALQCSPDHPWVAQHPEWFNRRPDGTIRFAENPPKQYQDIYPINFWPEREADRAALWAACHDVLVHWIGLACASSGSTTPTPSRSPSGPG